MKRKARKVWGTWTTFGVSADACLHSPSLHTSPLPISATHAEAFRSYVWAELHSVLNAV